MKKWLALWLLIAAVGTISASPAIAQSKYLSVGAGPTGGVYYPLGGGIASQISKHLEGIVATAEATSGSIDNVKLVAGDASYLGLASADIVQQAISATGPFEGEAADVSTLAVLYPNVVQIVVRAESGIKTVAELKGKRVSTGTPGSGFEVLSNRVLAAAGLNPHADIRRATLATGDAISALRDGKVDAVFFAGGVPAGSIAELAASPGVDLDLVPTADLASALNEKYGENLYSVQEVAAGAYGDDIAEPVATLGVWNLLLVNSSMPSNEVRAICDVIFGRLDEFYQLHSVAKGVTLANQKRANSPSPFHVGAQQCIEALGSSLD